MRTYHPHTKLFPKTKNRRMKNKTPRNATFGLPTFMSTFLLITFSILCSVNAYAQPCNLTCKPGPIQFPLGNGCQANIVAANLLLTPPTDCPGFKTGSAFTGGGMLIGNTITSAHLGQTLNVIILDITSGNTCMTSISVVDTTKPTLICQQNINVSCNANLAPSNFPAPIITDNCTNPLIPVITDVTISAPCPAPQKIRRLFRVTDGSGNSATCLTTINLIRPNISEVQFNLATGFVALCSANPEDLVFFGQPTLAGNPIDLNGLCNFTSQKFDTTMVAMAPLTGTTFKRTWKVSDNCTGEMRTALQVFTIPDTTPPTITCPADLTLTATNATCPNPLQLPAPIVFDACAANPPLTVDWSFGDDGLGPYQNIPSGTYNVTYTVTDFALNTATCSYNLTIIDNIEPVALCKSAIVVSLNNIAPQVLYPEIVNKGSFDNCGIVSYQLDLLGDGLLFQDSLLISCGQVNQNFLVVLQVTDPSGLTSTCETQLSVQDKLPPILLCPVDVTVDCSSDFGNLDVYGLPQLIETCLDTSFVTVFNNQDNCQIGNIQRVFTAIDAAGNSGQCTHTIFIDNKDPFDGTKIVWPQDFISYDCVTPDNFDPEDLVQPFKEPMLPTDDPCALITVDHKDHVFMVNPFSCYKIMRDWRVINWCQYDPNAANPKGIWTFTQLLKIQDTIPPVLTCVDTIVANVGPDCKKGFVNVPLPMATDCGENIKITNNSFYSILKGPDASGTYPLGETKVQYTASDGCGNFSFCTALIVVKDIKKPTPKCLFGLATDLGYMGVPTLMVCIPAKAFNVASIDNCTPTDKLIFSFSPDTSDTKRIYDCSDKGINNVQVWVTDLEGNQDFCVTFIDVQDNMFPCTAMKNINVSGTVSSLSGKTVEDVEVQLEGGKYDMKKTSDLGKYAFADLSGVQSFNIKPSMESPVLNGVNTLDFIMIQNHILAKKLLPTAYHLISADLDGDGQINSSDLLWLQKIFLHNASSFPGDLSWRFIDKHYQFPQPNNPWKNDLPESIELDSMGFDIVDADFYGLKLGDVNGSAKVNLMDNTNEVRSGDWNITLTDLLLKPNKDNDINVALELKADDLAFRLNLGYKPDWIESIEVVPYGSITQTDLNHESSEYMVRIMKSKPAEGWQASGLNLKIRVKAEVNVSDLIKLPKEGGELVTEAEELNAPILKYQYEPLNQSGFDVGRARPNPFNNQSSIDFYLPKDTDVSLFVMDPLGRQVIQKRMSLPAGYQQVIIDASELAGPGVYLCTLSALGERQTVRLVLEN